MLDTTANAAAIEAIVSDLLRQAFWSIAYHEAELPKAHRKVANASALLQRANLLLELTEARKIVDAMDDEEDPRNLQQFAASLLVDAADSVKYHETNLTIGHTKLAHAKALMRRCGLDIPLHDIEAKARERANA